MENELDIEDSLKIASKEWNRIINTATKVSCIFHYYKIFIIMHEIFKYIF